MYIVYHLSTEILNNICRFVKSPPNAEKMFSLGNPEPLISQPKRSDIIAGGYTMIPQKYYHPNAGRNALGLIGGNEVSLASGNLVDLESDLRGITRDLSHAPAKKYQPSCALGGTEAGEKSLAPLSDGSCPSWPRQIVFAERGTNRAVSVSTTPRHLPTIQMMSYPGVPAPTPFTQEVYGAPWRF